MTTSKDIARLAGVSRATVSRVLNGSPHVSPTAHQRVLEAIKTTGYEPDLTAQNLVRQSSNTIALGLFSDDNHIPFSNPGWYHFYFDILAHIEQEAAVAGYDLILPSRRSGDMQHYVRVLRQRRAAGAILLNVQQSDARLHMLIDSTIPTVFIDVLGQGRCSTYVKSDNIDGARQAIEHLLHLGHRKIAILSGWSSALSGMERLFGYQQALTAAGIVPDPALVRQTAFGADEAYQCARELLAERRDFTAIVAGSDLMALGIFRALREQGLRVPEDISLVGFDDIDLCLYTNPPLTTIRQDRIAMGRGAVRKLLALIEGKIHLPPLVTPTQLIVRSSTSHPSVPEP